MMVGGAATPHGSGDDGPSVVQHAAGHGAFDPVRPPSPDVLADCVHCGFCLPACPTYSLWGQEMDSPRGRIYLMDLASRGDVALDDVFVTHMDRCLGCMACVTACPSGVRYDQLIEATRAQIERNHPREPAERWFRRLVFALFPRPGRLRVAACAGIAYRRLRLGELLRRTGLFSRLPLRLRTLESLLPDVAVRDLRRRLPTHVPPRRLAGERAAPPPVRRVALLTGCVQAVYFGDVNAATARVLAMEGCEVVVPSAQGCCGALFEHAGEQEAARAHARRTIATMEAAAVDTVVVNAAGCGSTLKGYGHLLRDDPVWAARAATFAARVRDVTELVAELAPRAPRHPVRARVAYHDACHLAHAQGVRAQPRAVLRAVPGLELVELAESEMCCGSAGIYNLLQPDAAADLGRRKAAAVTAVAPDAVVTANPGCLLQLRAHLGPTPPLLHPVQVLDASLRGVDPLGR